MKRDAFIGSVHAGVLAALVYGVLDLAFLQAGLKNIGAWTAAAGMFVTAEQTTSSLGTLVGWIAHFTLGALWGGVLYGLLFLTGARMSVYKGVLLGFFIWLFDAAMANFGVTGYAIVDAREQLMMLVLKLTFGGTLGYLVPRFAPSDSKVGSRFLGLMAGHLAVPAQKPGHDDQQEK